MFNQGFTVIEFVVVIVIAAIITVALINWPSHSINLDAQAQQLASDIRYAQHLAMTRGDRVRVNFAAGNYSFTETDGTTAINLPGKGTNVVALESGVTLSTSGLPSGILVFDAQGVPYTDAGSPGTVLTSTAKITLTLGSVTKNVTVAPETGIAAAS